MPMLIREVCFSISLKKKKTLPFPQDNHSMEHDYLCVKVSWKQIVSRKIRENTSQTLDASAIDFSKKRAKLLILKRMFYFATQHLLTFPGGPVVKESACQCRRCVFYPWVRKIPWRWKWLPTPVFLLGEPHGQRCLVGYSSQGCKELDMIE